MNVPKNIKRFWMWVGIALLVELAAFTLWKRWYWFFPTHAVSEVYTRYAGTDGLNVVFFKDYRVNDTVFVDVTLLEAIDTTAWEELCSELHIPTIEQVPVELREMLLSDKSFGYREEKDTLINKNVNLINLYIYSRIDMTVCVFHTLTEKQYDAIIDKEIDKRQSY